MQAQSLSLIVYPSGIRHTWIQTTSCRMLIIPRTALATARAETGLDLRCPSLYILLQRLSPADAPGPVRTYIGHAEDLLQRLAQHLADPEKNFFRWVIAIQATDGTFDKSLVQYLESWAIATVRRDPRFDLSQNKNTPALPHLAPDRLIAATHLTDSLIPLLLSTTPCPLFSTAEAVSIDTTPDTSNRSDGIEIGAPASLPSHKPPINPLIQQPAIGATASLPSHHPQRSSTKIRSDTIKLWTPASLPSYSPQPFPTKIRSDTINIGATASLPSYKNTIKINSQPPRPPPRQQTTLP